MIPSTTLYQRIPRIDAMKKLLSQVAEPTGRLRARLKPNKTPAVNLGVGLQSSIGLLALKQDEWALVAWHIRIYHREVIAIRLRLET